MTHIFDWWNNLRQLSSKRQVATLEQHQCKYCGKPATEEVTLEIDQSIPSSRSGRYDHDNLQLMCSECRPVNGTTID
ncbi:MAG: HNH endonuclease [Anaerolineaceae bacterium]|nr:HNH endonuclease [Anaerolineaceae bacterium]